MISTSELIVFIIFLNRCYATEYIVGDTFWSIPTTNHFYEDWSSSHFFQIGDNLLFDFDSGLHDVMQVSAREHQICSSDQPFVVFRDGPARVILQEEGVFYFICSIANYCNLGQKLAVVVNRRNSSSPAPRLSPGRSHPFSSSEHDDGVMESPPFQAPEFGGSRGGGYQSCGGVSLAWFAAIFHVVFYFNIKEFYQT